jgi:choline kinase
MQRTGVILSAGIGSRLNNNNYNKSFIKPLTTVDGLILLLRTIKSLEISNCERIVIVVGWQAGKVKDYITSHYCGSATLEFVTNNEYHLQNGISVLCARPFVEGDFILTMADHILDEQIMCLARDHHPPEGGATLCVDYKLETIFDIDDGTKVLAQDSLIRKIGKNLKKYNCIDTGVFIGTDGLIDAIDHVYKEKGDASLSEGVQLLANHGLMEALDIKDAFWQDVDNMEMLLHAEKLLNSQVKTLKKYAAR